MSVSTSTEILPGRASLDATNPGPFAPAVVIADVSSSMASQMGELNSAIQELVDDLSSHEVASTRADVAIVSFATTAQVVTPMTIARDLQVQPMTAGGTTAMGEAINLALDVIVQRQDEYRATGVKANVPMVFLLTDGYPTDEWRGAADRVHTLAAEQKLCFFGIGTSSADMSTLTQICPPEIPPLRMRDGGFSQLFRFVSDSLIRRSKVAPGGTVTMPSVQGWAKLNG